MSNENRKRVLLLVGEVLEGYAHPGWEQWPDDIEALTSELDAAEQRGRAQALAELEARRPILGTTETPGGRFNVCFCCGSQDCQTFDLITALRGDIREMKEQLDGLLAAP